MSKFNTGNVTNMNYVFSNGRAFNQGVSGFDVSKVELAHDMFAKASVFDKPIPSFHLDSIYDMCSTRPPVLVRT